MNKQTNKERKLLRREKFKVTPSSSESRIHPSEKLARKLRTLPIARVDRRIKRAARAQRRGEAVLATLAPNSKFAAPVKRAIHIARVSAFIARAEIKRRLEPKEVVEA